MLTSAIGLFSYYIIMTLSFYSGDVAMAASAAPRVFFKTVFYSGEAGLVSQLVPLLLERTVLLYNIPAFQTQVRK